MCEEYQMKKNEVLFILAGLRNLHPAEQKAVDYAMKCVRNAPDYLLANPFGEDQRKQALKERREIAKRHGWTIGKGILEETTYVKGQDSGEWYVPIRLVEKELMQEVGKWIPVSERPPKKIGDYLVTRQAAFSGHVYRSIASYSLNLYEVDEYDFEGKKRPGWYNYDSECGYFEIDNVIAWMPLPEPYKEVQGEDCD